MPRYAVCKGTIDQEHAELIADFGAERICRPRKLIRDLRESGCRSQADEVETAIRGGATSGEALGRLSNALPAVWRAGCPAKSLRG